jgi:hypothetical protein
MVFLLNFKVKLKKYTEVINFKKELNKLMLVYTNMKHILLTSLIVFSTMNFSTEIEEKLVNSGDIWTLGSGTGNNMSIGGEVLYLMPNSAYETYRSRKFSDWNQFSMVDTRNLVKLRRGYQFEIIEGLYQDNIFKVKLLSGNSKGRNYYVIAEDLLKKYTLNKKLATNNTIESTSEYLDYEEEK